MTAPGNARQAREMRKSGSQRLTSNQYREAAEALHVFSGCGSSSFPTTPTQNSGATRSPEIRRARGYNGPRNSHSVGDRGSRRLLDLAWAA